ncbi:MAG: hypothetical protein JW937_04825 [Candidatus Omnitrophica bacterium]|nr:hypothetical protein [Candidatus Omnitrophota bacterium]
MEWNAIKGLSIGGITFVVGFIVAMSLAYPPVSLESAEDVIRNSRSLDYERSQRGYLIAEAGHFLRKGDHPEAVKIARHILEELDKEDEVARRILREAITGAKSPGFQEGGI